jgi:hypothetical protein
MNRSLPGGDCRRQSPATGWAPGRRRAVPGARGLVGGVTAHSAGRPQIATGAPQVVHVRSGRDGLPCGPGLCTRASQHSNRLQRPKSPTTVAAGPAACGRERTCGVL